VVNVVLCFKCVQVVLMKCVGFYVINVVLCFKCVQVALMKCVGF